MISNHSAKPSELHILPNDSNQAVPEKQRRTYYAFDEDDQAVAAIRKRYGCSTDSDAVRLALRLLAGEAIKVSVAPTVSKRSSVKFKARPMS